MKKEYRFSSNIVISRISDHRGHFNDIKLNFGSDFMAKNETILLNQLR